MTSHAVANPVPAIELKSMLSPGDTAEAELVREFLTAGGIDPSTCNGESEDADHISWRCTCNNFSLVITIYKTENGQFWIWGECAIARLDLSKENEILRWLLETQYRMVSFKVAIQPETNIIVVQLRDSLTADDLFEKLRALVDYSDYIFEELQKTFQLMPFHYSNTPPKKDI